MGELVVLADWIDRKKTRADVADKKQESSSEFDDRLARIRTSLGKINSVMAAIRSEAQKKERESSNAAILRNLGKAD